MALGLNKPQACGVDAYYWRIDSLDVCRSMECVIIKMNGYKDAAAASAGKSPIPEAEWNEKYTGTDYNDFLGTVDVRAKGYDKAKLHVDWTGAVDI